MSWAKCSECEETFSGDWLFDRHRINMTGHPGYDPEYDWRCATPKEMAHKGWHQDSKGWWHSPGSRPARVGSTRSRTKATVIS